MSRTLKPRPGDVVANLPGNRVRIQIDRLIRFLGANRVSRAIAKVDSLSGACLREEQREVMPWSFGFWDIERASAQLSESQCRTLNALAIDAAMIDAIRKTFSPDVRAKMIPDLIDDRSQLNFQHECRIAWMLQRQAFTVRWNLKNKTRGEFTAKGHRVSFDVECRRFDYDALNKVKNDVIARVSDHMLRAFRTRRYWGSVDLKFSAGFSETEEVVKALRGFVDRLRPGSCDIEVGSKLAVHVVAHDRPSSLHSHAEFQSLTRDHVHSEVWFAFADPAPDGWTNPVLIRSVMPRLDGLAALDLVHDTLKDKAKQLSADRPGMLVARLDFITDALILKQSTEFASRLRRLFDGRPHIAALQLSGRPEFGGPKQGAVRWEGGPIITNPHCRFPEVAAVIARMGASISAKKPT